ncbi:MAG: bifunctional alpha,alpha-trehalose-phosphate synthase (UDP-forming)/trehalose-phosphatase [Cyclobacteriaceae bacterium]
MSKTIIVSNRLPISISKNETGELEYKPSSGGLATGLGSIYKSGDNLWLGWPGTFFTKPENKEKVTSELKKENMSPVFLSEKEMKEFYEGFSNSTLWPLFHYFTQYVEYDNDLWEAYVAVNRKFCDEVLKHANDKDIIWIHDYQLLLLPQMIREKLPNASIGFFNHIPFPSYEIFRQLPWRKELLEGVLGADLIGFHTYDDMRHFLSAVSRICGIDHSMGHLKCSDRIVTVDALPMGIDYEKFANAAISKDTQKEVKQFYGSLHSEQLILSIDRLDYSKGIPQRLLAFDDYLDKYPDQVGKVSLIMLVVPSRDNVEHYMHLKEELDELVGRINGKHGSLDWTPIYYFYRSLPFHKLSALYCMADVALVTPLRDGMNLVCKEYIASRLDKSGALILSETAGSAKELADAIQVNPNDRDAMVEAIHQALTMDADEQERHISEMQDKLKRYDINRWVDVFMKRLHYTKEKQKELIARQLSEKSKELIANNYKKAEKRLIYLDYDGTLVGFHSDPLKATPDKELHSIMKALTEDEKNTVLIISGRGKDTLQEWFGDYKNLEFIAEHGVWHKEKGEEWTMAENLQQDWQEEILQILELYVDRTPGTFIEKKDFSLVWHFRAAEAGFGELRARELVSNLQYLTSNMDVQVLEGNKVIEVKNAGINKGKSALRWLAKENWDFITALGDDWTDEDTFHVMPESAFTIKVGLTASEARYNIKSPIEVRELLTSFIK